MSDAKTVHCIGIGGVGMAGLARCLLERGWRVSGCDQKAGAAPALAAAGARILAGHDPAHLDPPPALVVRSAAIRDDHPEVAAARRAGIEVLKYAELLGRLAADRDGIAVAGCHGKTTTAGWIAWLLDRAGLAPGFVIGGTLPQFGTGGRAGTGRPFVVEACEYDRSFHHFRPRIAVITNIEEDHLDYYRDLDEIAEAFEAFAAPAEVVVGCADDARVRRILGRRPEAARSYALHAPARWQARDVAVVGDRWRFEALHDGVPAGRFAIAMAGAHNVANALAVLAVGAELGIAAETAAAALGEYTGVARRFQVLGERRGVSVVDDYAHHPTEIAAVIAAARARWPGRPVWCVFQPHQHSRTRALLRAFAGAFAGADRVLLPDIFFARDSEEERRRVTSEDLARLLAGRGTAAAYRPAFDDVLETLEREIPPGAVLVTLGAGNVDEVARRFLAGGAAPARADGPGVPSA